jgi:hypothetical protein
VKTKTKEQSKSKPTRAIFSSGKGNGSLTPTRSRSYETGTDQKTQTSAALIQNAKSEQPHSGIQTMNEDQEQNGVHPKQRKNPTDLAPRRE